MKRLLSIGLVTALALGTVITSGCGSFPQKDNPPVIQKEEGLRVHAVNETDDTAAWHIWQSAHDDLFKVENPSEKYFFLPTSADENAVDIYNNFSETVTVNGTSIEPGAVENVAYTINTPYEITVKEDTYTLTFMKSNAEAALFINNDDVDGTGTDIFSYLNNDKENADKSRTATADSALVDADGNIITTPIKKVKGRGNTSWWASKKSYNVTFEKPVSVAGMKEGKKYSMLANFQDDSLSRSRILYDLSDAVGIPYASDSRYTDLYINGFYCGSYQMCEKISAGNNSLINDISSENYLNADGSVKEDFPFFVSVDPSVDKNKDYYIEADNYMLTIEYPELQKDDPGYNEVKSYVAEKYKEFYDAAKANDGKFSEYADVDSCSKMFLINELGKNWDSGVSSVYFVYKPDENGKYKFYASPVWDYDNSLGNCTGIKQELKYFKITDYNEYTGWWCEVKGGEDNIINRFANNDEVKACAKAVWFDSFVPAIDYFSGKTDTADTKITNEIYTADKYYSLAKDSAEMNYKSGWLLKPNDWVADHSSLTKAHFDESSKQMVTDDTQTTYEQNYTDMYNYCCDWLTSRAAWISQEYSK